MENAGVTEYVRPLRNKWTPADDERLRRLVAEGHSCGKIAGLIGGRRSKNSVLGRIHRLGLHLADEKASPTPRPREPMQEPPATTRDPCPRCQVRGDIGCAHRAPGAATPRVSSRA